ncbi:MULTISPECIES: HK97-gp10 family putative phage morphogenesis protein [unclassified Terribacillus]|uniref:HK97-gp10 family putative phage morphogenesis protein n=1 Tax=unclassified Terribacillus TaxID=2636508 RepID=UPI0015840CD7|nr:HK97-gp10 family putative phage morphogenesis protein [Terribacillus sp. AE2B 122]
MRFEFEGIDELIRKIESLGQDTTQAKEKAVEAAANIYRDEVESLIRARGLVATGKMAKSIIVKKVDGEIAFDVGPSDDGWYLIFHEIGTSKMKATPTMLPAFENTKAQMISVMAETLRKELRL